MRPVTDDSFLKSLYGTPVEGCPELRHMLAEANGIRQHYVIGGSGPLVVLLHGYPFTWAFWQSLMPLLIESGYCVMAPDLRGLGHSEKAEDGYDKVTIAEDVGALVRSVGDGTKIHLVGADIGAMVAYAYASRYPEQVAKFVFAESLIPGFGLEERMNPATGGSWHFGFHAQVETATMLTEGREREYLKGFYDMMSLRNGMQRAEQTFLPAYQAPGGMRAGFKHYQTLLLDGEHNRADFKGRLTIPTLVLSGEHGIPQAQTLECVRQVASHVEHDIVPDAGHTFASDNPSWTAARLHAFFQRDVLSKEL